MQHIFILNPAAGKHQTALSLIPQIEAAAAEMGCDYQICETQVPGDGTRLAQEAIAAAGEEAVRLYACGGDGTLWEVMCAITPGSDTELAHIPCGSGNDYVRMLGGEAPYLDLPAMMGAQAYPMDGIVCYSGEEAPRRALNIAATGMDAQAAYHMSRFKRWPLVSGPMAYNLALIKVFFGKLGCRMTVEMDTQDGPIKKEGRYLFALASSGEYYGGGYHAVPTALPDDGYLDFVLVETMPRLRILNLLPKYKKGTHVGERGVQIYRGTAMTVRTEKVLPVTLDGECFLTDHFRVEIQPGAYRMVLPDAVAAMRKQPILA